VGDGVGVAAGVGLAVGVGVAVSVGVGLGEALALVDPGLGETAGLGRTVTCLWVVATAARITVLSPLSVVGVATGSRSGDGLALICGLGVTSAATGGACVAPVRRALKYTMVNTVTRIMRARLAATSVGANIDLIESHMPFPRMASVPPCEPLLVGPFYPMATRQPPAEMLPISLAACHGRLGCRQARHWHPVRRAADVIQSEGMAETN
jgi:hypothetical protein